MRTTKTTNDKPAEGHAILSRVTDSFRRASNGAWLPGGSTTENFEIPLEVLNSPEGCGWLNPGRCSSIFVCLPDDTFITVDGAHTPVRTNGFGELGEVVGRGLVNRPHPLLPNIAPQYSTVGYLPDSVVETFVPLNS